MEEERRLAYVGMTRARERLYLSHAWQRATRRGPGTSWMAEPSRFLLEIPAELMSGPRLGARPAARPRRRRPTGRPQPRLRARGDAVRAADPARRRGVPGGERPARRARGRASRSGRQPGSRGEARGVRRRSAIGHARAARFARRWDEDDADRRAPTATTSAERRAGAGAPRARPPDRAADHPRRAPLPRRRSGPPRPLGRRHRRQLEADPERRGGHGRLPRSADRAQDRARARSPASSSSADRARCYAPADDRAPCARGRPGRGSSTSRTSSRSAASGWPGRRTTTSPAARGTRSRSRENVEAWRRYRFVPRVLVDVRERRPVGDVPRPPRRRCRSRSPRWPPRRSATPTPRRRPLRGRGAAGIPYCLSTLVARSIEDCRRGRAGGRALVPAVHRRRHATTAAGSWSGPRPPATGRSS